MWVARAEELPLIQTFSRAASHPPGPPFSAIAASTSQCPAPGSLAQLSFCPVAALTPPVGLDAVGIPSLQAQMSGTGVGINDRGVTLADGTWRLVDNFEMQHRVKTGWTQWWPTRVCVLTIAVLLAALLCQSPPPILDVTSKMNLQALLCSSALGEGSGNSGCCSE